MASLIYMIKIVAARLAESLRRVERMKTKESTNPALAGKERRGGGNEICDRNWDERWR